MENIGCIDCGAHSNLKNKVSTLEEALLIMTEISQKQSAQIKLLEIRVTLLEKKVKEINKK